MRVEKGQEGVADGGWQFAQSSWSLGNQNARVS